MSDNFNLIQAELKLPGEKNAVFRCSNVSFSPDQNYVLLGPSGCGKSSFLDFLQDQSPLVVGRMEKYFAPEIATRIYQDLNLIQNFSILENAQLDLKTSEELRIFSENFKFLGLKMSPQTLISKLSYGERQRVAVAKAAAKNTIWILADEPTSNLDPIHAHLVIECLVKSKKSLIVVTHDHGLKKFFTKVIDFTQWTQHA
ncbi:MAG: ATP-binding cassette domain-containing protein [Moraxellaceae bacterium]|nr:ATP-binding cassette domain-containing protein [Pseudobdellovibrionaceae bacterium]